jgi:hypothetical protein
MKSANAAEQLMPRDAWRENSSTACLDAWAIA